MNRERALKIVMGLVGLLFLAFGYLVVAFARQEPALAMMSSVYFTLGIFLLLAVRNPRENRTLIAFTAWSSFAHAGVMGFQAYRGMIAHGELIGVAILAVIGVALIALGPGKQPESQARTAAPNGQQVPGASPALTH
jgi:drug/metabolite transporter (DMT)-like permease